jgi:vitamin B12 transporter
MRHVLYLSVSVTALFAAVCAHAAGPPAASSPDVAGAVAANALDQVVVVANRTAEPLDKVGQSFTVLTLEQIRADQEPVVSDILARTPGVTVSRNGGVGETTALNIRGAQTDQTVVMIDGVKLNDPSSPGGGYDFADLLVGDVARMEVLRGPQSTLYGSQAIGGVVNIVTAEPTGPLQGDVQVEGGSYGTFSAKAAVGGRSNALSWRLSATDYSTSGISAFDKALGGREADGYANQGVSGRVGYDLTPDVSLDVRGVYVHSRSDFDGFSTPTFAFGDDLESGTTEEAIAYAGLNFNLLGDRLKNRIAGQYTSTERDTYDPADAPVTKTFDGLGTNARAEYQGVFAIAPGWQGVFGAEHEQSQITASSPAFDLPGAAPIRGRAQIDSGYAQLQAQAAPGLNLTGGVRYDDHSTFGGHTVGQAAAAWSLNGGDTVLRASWGQGFKAPSLYELYSQYGALGLNPEQATGWDGGVQQWFWNRRVDVQATYFSRDTSNQIIFIDCLSTQAANCANGRAGYYANVAKAQARGVELSGAVRPLAGLSITANYTRTDDTDRSPGSATLGKTLPRIPRDMANAEASYLWPIKLTTAVAVRYAGDSYNDAADTMLLRAYTLVDLRAAYPVTPTLELYGRIENLADTRYETTSRYGSLGRAAYVGVRAAF